MKLKELIKECFVEMISEELDVPSQDGTSDGASEEDKEKAKKATQSGEDVKFVKPGELEESAADGDKTPSEESGELPIKEEEVAPKVKEVFATLQGLSEDIASLDEFSEKEGDTKMKKMCEKFAKSLADCAKMVGEMKNSREAIMQEDAEKASVYGDKVIKALGKYCKDDKHSAKIKEKYMPFIAKAHKKGKSPKDIAERIAAHRFEM